MGEIGGNHQISDSVVSGTYAACVATNDSMAFVGRYIPKDGASATGDLTGAEATQLTENGLAILVVRHYRGGSSVHLAAIFLEDASRRRRRLVTVEKGVLDCQKMTTLDNVAHGDDYAPGQSPRSFEIWNGSARTA